MSPDESPARDFAREVLRIGRKRDGRTGGHDEFALRDKNIGPLGAKPNTNVAVASVFLDDIGDVIGWNAECIDHRRRLMNAHCNLLPAQSAKCARGKVRTALTYVASELSSYPFYYRALRAQVDSNHSVPCREQASFNGVSL